MPPGNPSPASKGEKCLFARTKGGTSMEPRGKFIVVKVPKAKRPSKVVLFKPAKRVERSND